MSQCYDHLGNEYPSMSAMAKAYGLSPSVLTTRLNRDWSFERALTTPPDKGIPCKDHTGKTFSSLKELAEAYHMEYEVLKARLTREWDIESALTTPPRERRSGGCSDHLGNHYPDQKSMAEAYGIEYTTLRNRLERGWNQKEALTAPNRARQKTVCFDHLGNEYPSRRALA